MCDRKVSMSRLIRHLHDFLSSLCNLTQPVKPAPNTTRAHVECPADVETIFTFAHNFTVIATIVQSFVAACCLLHHRSASTVCVCVCCWLFVRNIYIYAKRFPKRRTWTESQCLVEKHYTKLYNFFLHFNFMQNFLCVNAHFLPWNYVTNRFNITLMN